MLILKIYYQLEVRRLSVEENISWEGFQRLLAQLFPTLRSYTVKVPFHFNNTNKNNVQT